MDAELEYRHLYIYIYIFLFFSPALHQSRNSLNLSNWCTLASGWVRRRQLTQLCGRQTDGADRQTGKLSSPQHHAALPPQPAKLLVLRSMANFVLSYYLIEDHQSLQEHGITLSFSTAQGKPRLPWGTGCSIGWVPQHLVPGKYINKV